MVLSPFHICSTFFGPGKDGWTPLIARITLTTSIMLSCYSLLEQLEDSLSSPGYLMNPTFEGLHYWLCGWHGFPLSVHENHLLPYIQLEVDTSILWFHSILPTPSSYVKLFRWYISTRYCRFMGLTASCELVSAKKHLLLMNWVTLLFVPDSWFRGGSFHRTPMFRLVFGDLALDTPLIFNPRITCSNYSGCLHLRHCPFSCSQYFYSSNWY